MTHFQIDTIQWPALFISGDNKFFHVVANQENAIRHAFGDVEVWLGPGAVQRGRIAGELAGIDVFDRSRMRLRIVGSEGGLSVRRSPDAERVPEKMLLRRISSVLELLETARAANPELAEEKIPLPVDGYSAYLDHIAALLLSAPAEHQPARHGAAAGAGRLRSTATRVGQVFLAAGAAELPLVQSPNPNPHPRGWLHNLMHQAWG